MRFSTALLLAGAVSAVNATSLTRGQLKSRNALKNIMERQVTICKPVTTPSCALSCGEGNIVCISWPTCYNPSAGETCCSDGNYCPAGSYCTDSGCCPNSATLAECGATTTLSVIPPPAAESTSSSTSSVTPTPSPETTPTPTPTPEPTSTPTPTPSPEESTSSTTVYAPPTVTATPTPSSNGTATTTPPLQVTNAAQNMGVGPAQIAIGGLGALFMML